ncbi:hypothetical protein GKC44_11330, partial [Lactobacillus parabuchneri]|nr:hypothetical protein [Lentilactobacillus parabuchneri]
SDDKWYSRLCVSDIIDRRMKELPLKYPDLPDSEKAKLEEALQELDDDAVLNNKKSGKHKS